MRLSLQMLALVLALPTCAAIGEAQLAPMIDAPPESAAPDAPPVAASAPVVDLYFIVKDSHGVFVPDLTRQNCSVLDDEVPQTLKSFATESNHPLNLGVLLDTSASQYSWLPMEQDSGSRFLRQVMRSQDQAFLGSFDTNMDLLQDYTNSSGLLIHALNTASINGGSGTIDRIDPGAVRDDDAGDRQSIDPGPVPIRNHRGTLLYDAIAFAAKEKMNRETGRKAMIVLTNGDDQGSSSTSQDAVAAAESNNVPVYLIWAGSSACLEGKDILRRDYRYPPRRKLGNWRAECDRAQYSLTACPGYSVARCIAEHTGGRFILAQNSKQFEQAFQQIEDELRTQYAATYTPENLAPDGSFHSIEVRCHGDQGENLRVQVRKGYYAPSPAK